MSRGQLMLDLLKAKRERDDLDDDSSSEGSSAPPPVPPQLMDLLNSDDSDMDPHYIPDENQLDLLSSEEDEPVRKKKNVSKSFTKLKEVISEVRTPPNVFQEFRNEEDVDNPAESVVAEVSHQNESELNNDNQIGEECVLTKRGTIRKRGLKGESRKVREGRKDMRNKGYEYKTKTGKIVKAKISIALDQCRNKCSEKVTDNLRQKLFVEYWGMSSYDRRSAYIGSLIDFEKPKRRRVRNENENNKFRQISIKYNIEVEGTKIMVCKNCFVKIFGESRKMIETVVQKKRASTSGIVDLDMRGKFQKTNLPENTITQAQEFLRKIPAYESHYSRRDCGKKFVSPHLTITSIYNEYTSTTIENGINPMSYRKFTEEFHKSNLKIKKPKVDTCAKCDSLALKAKLTPNQEVVRELEDHHIDAEYAYDAKKADKIDSKLDDNSKTVTFDMQQCLPTPLVQNSVAFYKRQLWTFNLTVYDCDDGVTHCYLWHEGIAARGANEIGSCVYKFILNDLKPEVKSLTMYSDTCGGQNKNTHVAAMCMVSVEQSPSLEELNHKFLVPGHTHMECDTSHALIEKNKKLFGGNIHHPHDWAQLIQATGKKNPFQVKELTQEDFFDFADLLRGDLQQRKEDVVGNPFSWRAVQWLQYRKGAPGMIFYKTSLDPYQPFQCINFTRRGREDITLTPNMRYTKPNPIPLKKKKDILDLFPFISPTFHQFYNNLNTSEDLVDTYPDDIPEEEEYSTAAKRNKKTSKNNCGRKTKTLSKKKINTNETALKKKKTTRRQDKKTTQLNTK